LLSAASGSIVAIELTVVRGIQESGLFTLPFCKPFIYCNNCFVTHLITGVRGGVILMTVLLCICFSNRKI
jgi:hypothetical protein